MPLSPPGKKAIKLIGRADKSQKDQVTTNTERQTVTDRQKENCQSVVGHNHR